MTRFYVLRTLRRLGPLSDWALAHAVQAQCAGKYKLSESGIRSRRAEMTREGLIEPTGKYETTPSGRKAAIYRVVR